MESKLTTFGRIWCWLGMISNVITGLTYIVAKDKIGLLAFAGLKVGMLPIIGIASLVFAGIYAWLFFGQKKLAFYALIGMPVIIAILTMIAGFGVLSAIIGAALSILVNWLIFRKALPSLD